MYSCSTWHSPQSFLDELINTGNKSLLCLKKLLFRRHSSSAIYNAKGIDSRTEILFIDITMVLIAVRSLLLL